jgi:very-short-patch-repair endonuclease
VNHDDLPKLGAKSLLEELFAQHLREKDCPTPVRQLRFHPGKKWQFDFAWPDWMVAVEIEGGVWSGGRHVRGQGFEADIEKYNAATLAGWRLYRFSGSMVKSGVARDFTLVALGFKV